MNAIKKPPFGTSKGDAKEGGKVTGNDQKQLSPLCPADFSDAGNAKLFAEQVKNSVRWCDATGWLVWDGQRWDTNEHEVRAIAMDFSQKMLDDAARVFREQMKTESGKIDVPEIAKKFIRHAERSRSKSGIDAFVDLTKSFLHIPAADLDSRWYELNTESGIYDLRTGLSRPHDPLAFHSKIAPFTPTQEGMSEWLDFLKLVHQGDTELINYRQMRVGMQLFGKIFTEDLEIDIGSGRNGKSSLNNAIFKVLGDYAGTLDSDVLTTDKQNKGPALATLRGKRFVICGELEEGQRLSVSFLKKIASTDPLTIEEKYKNPETVQPSHHIILYSNFLPRVTSADVGTWRRLTIVPYQATMPKGDSEIPNYADYLVSRCGGAILQWALDGARMFYQSGCQLKQQPQAIQNAIREYRESQDWLAAFLNERCSRDNPAARVRSSELYQDYRYFAQQNGEYPRRSNDFSRALQDAGFRRIVVNGRPYFAGIKLDYSRTYGGTATAPNCG